MGPAFDREAGHLSAHHAAFVAHWLRLLALEESGLAERRSEIWRLHGARCLKCPVTHWLDCDAKSCAWNCAMLDCGSPKQAAARLFDHKAG